MLTALIDDVPFKHRLSASEVVAAQTTIYSAKAAANALMAEHKATIKAKDAAAQDRLCDELFDSPSVWLAAGITAAKDFDLDRRPTLEECLGLADRRIDAVKSETARINPRPKKSGGFRIIHEFGIAHKTAQQIVLNVLGSSYQPRAFQYGQTGRGLHAAIRATKTFLLSGHAHFAKLDIRNFYPSFEFEKLITELPLPQEVVEHVVVGRQMKVVLDQEKSKKVLPALSSLPHTMKHLQSEARLGIPQGSSCSPLVSAFCMSRLPWHPMPGVALVNFADDFLLLSTGAELVEGAVGGLLAAVAELPGGHFELKVKATGVSTKGFDFLGHHFRMADGQLKTKPSPANEAHLFDKLARLDAQLGAAGNPLPHHGKPKMQLCLELAAKMATIIESWLAAFCECDNIERYLDWAKFQLASSCMDLGISAEQIANSTKPSKKFRLQSFTLAYD